MGAKFTRTSNLSRRVALMEKRALNAARIDKAPTVGVTFTATTPKSMAHWRNKSGIGGIRRTLGPSRTAGDNTVIFRTHRARGRKLRLLESDRKVVSAMTEKERAQAMQDLVHLRKLADAVGLKMVGQIKFKIQAERLIDTGQLLESVTYGTKNI